MFKKCLHALRYQCVLNIIMAADIVLNKSLLLINLPPATTTCATDPRATKMKIKVPKTSPTNLIIKFNITQVICGGNTKPVAQIVLHNFILLFLLFSSVGCEWGLISAEVIEGLLFLRS